jgi:predicted anti-sigma-YlaC factor YlaD
MKGLMKQMIYPCSQIRDFVFDYAEGNLDTMVALRFKMHIAACKDCNEYVRLYQMAANMQVFRKVKAPPKELIESTMEFLQQEGIADFSEDPDRKNPHV